MDLSPLPLENILAALAAEGNPVALWFNGQTLAGVRLISWDPGSGTLVCRGGHGFADDDVHFVRGDHLEGVTVRLPASRPDSDRLGSKIREALRTAAAYPVNLAVRPDAFTAAPEPLAVWCANIVEAVAELGSGRQAMQAVVDQILLREGNSVAVLGGSTLILEARPTSIPPASEIRAAIERLL